MAGLGLGVDDSVGVGEFGLSDSDAIIDGCEGVDTVVGGVNDGIELLYT